MARRGVRLPPCSRILSLRPRVGINYYSCLRRVINCRNLSCAGITATCLEISPHSRPCCNGEAARPGRNVLSCSREHGARQPRRNSLAGHILRLPACVTVLGETYGPIKKEDVDDLGVLETATLVEVLLVVPCAANVFESDGRMERRG